jgi:streptogrisin C
VLVVAGTGPDLLSQALATLPGWVHTRTQTVRFSERTLQQAAAEAVGRLGRNASVTLDEVGNQVVVRVPGAGEVTAAAGVLSQRVAAGQIRVLAAAAGGYGNECDPLNCHPRTSGCDRTNCTPPLPAGTNLDLWSDITSSKSPEGRCTNGFNMRGSNGWVYTSTAGHCMAGASNVTSNDGRWIGYWTGGSYFNTTYPYDHSVLPFLVIGSTNYAVFWQPKNWVISGSNTSFPITGIHTYSQIANGWVACASGTMTGTTCGTVQGKDGGIIMNICQHHGDSGAPLFSQIDHTAYGLSIKDTTTDDSCPSGYRSYYTPISNIIGTQSDGVSLSVMTS